MPAGRASAAADAATKLFSFAALEEFAGPSTGTIDGSAFGNRVGVDIRVRL